MNPKDYKFCLCCYLPLPEEAKVMMCPECMQGLVINNRQNKMLCSIHNRQVKSGEAT